jgi:hypothetical protein
LLTVNCDIKSGFDAPFKKMNRRGAEDAEGRGKRREIEKQRKINIRGIDG